MFVRTVKTVVAKWLNETTEVVWDIRRHHSEQLQTILT